VNFADPVYLFGTAVALFIAALLIAGVLRGRAAIRRFGDQARVEALFTADPAKRRAWKGVLLVLAVALAFVAAARPQYGGGTRLIPATNLDVVIALDYSKSMYARDIEPSRIFRAKVEVARLVKELDGARFGAVAFAGDAMGFPLTPDGNAIAQYFRQLEPNDMPVGGTDLTLAITQADDLLRRDPKAKDHRRVIVLITDGEDLEGDPVAAARSVAAGGTVIDVVQLGGRTPEPIPDVGDDGKIRGFRQDGHGRPLTTELTVEGEKQLEQIAEVTGGQVVRAAKGTTGIDKIAAALKSKMKTELGERVELVYADVYDFPLGIAVLLLFAEVFLGDAPGRRFTRKAPPPIGPSRIGDALRGGPREA
jgi:Ca-activated chloride channel family protein